MDVGVRSLPKIAADRSRGKNRFKVWQQRHEWLTEMVAKFDWLTGKGNTHSQLIGVSGGSGIEREL